MTTHSCVEIFYSCKQFGFNQLLIFAVQDIFPDKATERNILSCQVRCPSVGCEWTGETRDVEVRDRLTVNHLVLVYL